MHEVRFANTFVVSVPSLHSFASMPKHVVEYWFGRPLNLVKYEAGDLEYDEELRTYDTHAEDFWILRGCAERIYAKCDSAEERDFIDLTKLWQPIDISRILDIFGITGTRDEVERIFCQYSFTLAKLVVRRSPATTIQILDNLFRCPALADRDVFALCTPFKVSWESILSAVTSELLETIRRKHFM